jgi:hypothetical protein
MLAVRRANPSRPLPRDWRLGGDPMTDTPTHQVVYATEDGACMCDRLTGTRMLHNLSQCRDLPEPGDEDQ